MTASREHDSKQLTLREVTALQLAALALIETPADGARVELSPATLADLERASAKLARAITALARVASTPATRRAPGERASKRRR